jgi:hypothetical protein
MENNDYERCIVWSLTTTTLGDLFQTPIIILPMEEFLKTPAGNWVEENANYIYWNLINTNLHEIEVNIYADFDQLNAMAYKIKFGHLK